MGIPFDFFERKVNLLAVGIFLVGLFVLALGAGLFFFKNSEGEDVQIISASQGEALQGSEVIVDVGGAVITPGIYRLSSSLRVDDAIKAAGGLADGADIAKMNLAAKISDGQKIFVPEKGEQSATGNQQSTINNLVNINSATEKDLDTLPGVGPVTAQKIIAGRPYSSLNDLLAKKAVSGSVYEKIKDLVAF